METIGAFEAKLHLSDLLDRVSQGEKITITRDGIPTAMLIPVEQPKKTTNPSHQDIVVGMQNLRSEVLPDTISIKEMIEEGRRF